jgi:hypothetical protein
MTRARTTKGSASGDGAGSGSADLLGVLGAAVSDLLGRIDAGHSSDLSQTLHGESDRGPFRAEIGLRIHVGGLAPQPGGRTSGAGGPETGLGEEKAGDGVRPFVPEITDDGRTWRLTADLPGISRDGLVLSVEGRTLSLSATGRDRRYAGVATLPPRTGMEDLRVRLRSGILEIEAPSSGAGGT